MDGILFEIGGELKLVGEISDVDLTVEDDSEVLLISDSIELELEAETVDWNIEELIPRGYRNAAVLRKDGYLSPANAADFQAYDATDIYKEVWDEFKSKV